MKSAKQLLSMSEHELRLYAAHLQVRNAGVDHRKKAKHIQKRVKELSLPTGRWHFHRGAWCAFVGGRVALGDRVNVSKADGSARLVIVTKVVEDLKNAMLVQVKYI